MGENKKISRHRWRKNINHPYCRNYTCEKCGAEKDAGIINKTIYHLNGEKFFNSPSCVDKTNQMFESTHKLDFLCAEWDNPLNDQGWMVFKIGTCHGQWRATKTDYEILSVVNDEPNNGHFKDVLEWFENSCKRDKRNLRILEVWNQRFALHLVNKQGFSYQEGDNLIKRFE